MEELPFAKREPRIRAIPPPQPRGVFDDCSFSTPQNQQTISTRRSISGLSRPPVFKCTAKGIDSRQGQLDRNRQNIFNETGTKINSSYSLPKHIDPKLRHSATPYEYSTYWISHPTSASLAPTSFQETFQTTFMRSPVAEMDMKNKSIYMQHKYEALRQNQKHFDDYVASIDCNIKTHDNDTLQGIRNQRTNHLVALEKRQHLEKIYCFE